VSRRVVVHSLEHARAALAAAAALQVPVLLASAPGAGAYAGPRWFLALVAEAAAAYPGVLFDVAIDCGDEPGTVLAALRSGCKRVIFHGSEAARARLADIAAAHGAALEAPGAASLDLLDARDPQGACQAYLAGRGTGD